MAHGRQSLTRENGMISYGDKMACHISDGPQTPEDDPADSYDVTDDAYDIQRQQQIDEAIEAGDHLLDQRKEQALFWPQTLAEFKLEIDAASIDVKYPTGDVRRYKAVSDSLVNTLADIGRSLKP